LFKEYTKAVDEQSRSLPRSVAAQVQFQPPPVPLEEVEPATEIVKRFKTGAMSFEVDRPRRRTKKSRHRDEPDRRKKQYGEGGEDPGAFRRDANGEFRAARSKQVASARFGVTSHYLVNADENCRSDGAGRKPGEGGQLPVTR